MSIEERKPRYSIITIRAIYHDFEKFVDRYKTIVGKMDVLDAVHRGTLWDDESEDKFIETKLKVFDEELMPLYAEMDEYIKTYFKDGLPVNLYIKEND